MLTVVLALIIVALFFLLCVVTLKRREVHYDGTILVTETDDKKLLALELDVAPDDLDQKKEIIFRVKKTEPQVGESREIRGL